jgi:hypothetical protein
MLARRQLLPPMTRGNIGHTFAVFMFSGFMQFV